MKCIFKDYMLKLEIVLYNVEKNYYSDNVIKNNVHLTLDFDEKDKKQKFARLFSTVWNNLGAKKIECAT